MDRPLKGFITYSHEDIEARNELRKRLAVMEQQNELVTWDDGQLTPGDKALQEDILEELADSDLLLYLVSASSLASKNCNKELTEALNQEIRVIPIILEHCDWLRHQLSDFEVLPHKGRPITKWEDESEGWQNVIDGIWKVIDEMPTQTESSFDGYQNRQLVEWVFQQGNFLMMLQQIDRAIEAYSYAVNLNPRVAGIYNNRGLAYGEKGNFERAIKDYNTAIKMEPELVIAYNNLGVAYFEKGNFKRAIKNYNTAIKMNPKLAEAYHNRGNSYLSTGKIERAIKDYNRAITLRPDYSVAYNSRGEAYRFKGEIEHAIKNYSTAIILNSDYVAAYVNRGLAYRLKGEISSAIKDYNKAIKLEPYCLNAYNDRGAAYADEGEFDLAIADFSKVIKLTPELALPYYNRGLVYGIRGEFDFAIADFSKAIELTPDIAAPYYTHKAIELTPDIAFTHYKRGEMWLHQSGWEKARIDLIVAKNMGVDIIASFHNDYESVTDFEQKTGIQFPEDIATMLTKQ